MSKSQERRKAAQKAGKKAGKRAKAKAAAAPSGIQEYPKMVYHKKFASVENHGGRVVKDAAEHAALEKELPGWVGSLTELGIETHPEAKPDLPGVKG